MGGEQSPVHFHSATAFSKGEGLRLAEDKPMGTDLSLVPILDEQAKAITEVAKLGTAVVAEVGQLARFFGRVLGTAPEDVVGLIVSDPPNGHYGLIPSPRLEAFVQLPQIPVIRRPEHISSVMNLRHLT